MDISVTDFKAHCLDLIRKVEKSGKAVTIRRRGKVVARLEPAGPAGRGAKPWEVLQALGGEVLCEPGESVLKDSDFEALR
jgi:antitoxin (DNA-binding transcriptional repressor) of toxin-antitoxin stability system